MKSHPQTLEIALKIGVGGLSAGTSQVLGSLITLLAAACIQVKNKEGGGREREKGGRMGRTREEKEEGNERRFILLVYVTCLESRRHRT